MSTTSWPELNVQFDVRYGPSSNKEDKMWKRIIALITVSILASIIHISRLHAFDGIVEKKTFTLERYTTVRGEAIKDVKIGWESYGSLNADKSNAILITHYFSGNSHAAGKYKPDENPPGYWDAIVGPGKPLDTDKYFILSSDTLVNLNAKDENVITTGPYTIKNPSTHERYGMSFPIVTIRDFVNVQKALVENLGIRKLYAVMGASMGAMQAYEWASSYPAMVGKVIPVISAGETDGWQIAWLHMWEAPILLDPNWNNGDYYGKAEPVAGLSTALALVTLDAQHWEWTNDPSKFRRKWASEGVDPASCLLACEYAIETELDRKGKERVAKSDANHFLYLVKAGQLFVTGGGDLAEGLKKIEAPVLLIRSEDDLIFQPDAVNQTARMIKADGTPVEHIKIKGGHGHLDGIFSIDQAGEGIANFLGKK
jgi:homoserine O-acetyltransferase